MENILLKLKEIHRVYPAIWDDFWERFKQGQAEYTTGIDGEGAAGNIYESLFLKEHRYPIILLDKHLRKTDIIEIIQLELGMQGESAGTIVGRLKSAAGRDLEKTNELKMYFQNTLDSLNGAFGLSLSFEE